MATSASVPTPNPKAPVLNSWKEIASYLGRGVRTVQRYEQKFHLPVRRLEGKTHAAVVALPEDLDAWLRSAPVGELLSAHEFRANSAIGAVHASIEVHHELRRQCHELRTIHEEQLLMLTSNLDRMLEQIELARALKNPPPRIFGGASTPGVQ